MKLTISSFQIQSVQRYPGTSVSLRIYYQGPTANFIASDGTIVECGNVAANQGFYVTVTGTISSNVITFPSFILDTTDDSDQPTVTATGIVFDQNSSRRETIFSNWVITATLGGSITFQQLYTFNLSVVLPNPPSSYLNSAGVAALINLSIGTLNDASSTVKGRTYLDVDPTVPSHPEAVGSNSARVPPAGAYYYALNYSSFAAAVTAMGTTVPVRLIVSEQMAVAADVTVTPNIQLQFVGNGRLIVATNKTVTIQGSLLASPSQWIFDVSASGAAISFSGNKFVSTFYPEWWGAVNWDNTSATDAAPAIQAAGNAAGNISRLEFQRNSNFAIYSQITFTSKVGLTLWGNGNHYPITSDAAMPTILWQGADGGTMIKFAGSYQCAVIGLHLVSRLTSTTGANKILDFDGPGFTSTHLTQGNVFDNQNQNDNFVAVNIADNGGNNNEFFRVQDNVFYVGDPGQGYNASWVVDDGTITSGTTTISTAQAGYFTHTAGGASAQNFVGQPIRITKAGIAGAVFETTITAVAVDGKSATLAANAPTSTTTGRIVVGKGYGVGVKIGASPNIKDVLIFRNNILWAKYGIHQLNGSSIVDDVSGGFSEYDFYAANFTEAQVVRNINTENSHVGLKVDAGSGTLTVENMRFSNPFQLTSYIQVGNVPVVHISNSGLEYEAQSGQTVFSFTNPSVLLYSQNNRWTPSTGFPMTMANLGWNYFQTIVSSGGASSGRIESHGDSGITDAPGGYGGNFIVGGFGGLYAERWIRGATLTGVNSPTSNATGGTDAIGVKGLITSNSNPGTPDNVIGLQGEIGAGATGVQIASVGVRSKFPSTLGNGVGIADYFGFQFVSPTASGGNHRDGYGLYLGAHPGAGISRARYGIYQAGVADINVLLGTLQLNGILFANLPASPVAGMVRTVTDSNTIVWGAAIAGGGANAVLAFYDGTNWTVFAK